MENKHLFLFTIIINFKGLFGSLMTSLLKEIEVLRLLGTLLSSIFNYRRRDSSSLDVSYVLQGKLLVGNCLHYLFSLLKEDSGADAPDSHQLTSLRNLCSQCNEVKLITLTIMGNRFRFLLYLTLTLSVALLTSSLTCLCSILKKEKSCEMT